MTNALCRFIRREPSETSYWQCDQCGHVTPIRFFKAPRRYCPTPQQSGRADTGVFTVPHSSVAAYWTCPHRGPVVATVTGQRAGCGCGGTPIEVYQCAHFKEPVLKQAAARCLEKIQAKAPGYTGRTCRECRVPMGNNMSPITILHVTHRVGWQDVVRRSQYAFSTRGCDFVSREVPKAGEKEIVAVINEGAKIVVHHAFANCDTDGFIKLAKRFPRVQFVALNHCSLNHTYRWPTFFDMMLKYTNAAKELQNFWYGGPDRFCHYLDFAPDHAKERFVWWPNPVMIPDKPSTIVPDPPLVMLACRDDLMKAIPAQMVAMALVKKQRPETKIAVSLCFGDKTIPHLKEFEKILDTKFEWWRYGSSDDWYRRLQENISVVMQVSAHESFGYVAVDAMGYGRPAVMGPSIVYGPDEWHCGTEQPRKTADVILGFLDHYEAASILARKTAEQVADSQNTAYVETIKRILENAT